MGLPPGHYGRAGQELEHTRPSPPPIEALSLRWFLPRSQRRRTVAAIIVGVVGVLLGFADVSASILIASFGLFHLLVLGVAFRRLHPAGRMWRRDPAGAAYVADERSHMSAVIGVVLVAAVL